MTLFDRRPLICLITDGTSSTLDAKLEIIRAAIEARIPLIQIREKHRTAIEVYELTQAAVEAAKLTDTRILVNERFDIALAAGADGVHLPSHLFDIAAVRRLGGGDFIIGVSTHSREEVMSAASNGADFSVFGPIFSTLGKGDPVGIESLASVVKDVAPFPVLGLGGIDRSNYASVMETGAAGLAAIRFLNDRENLELLEKLYGE